MQAISVVKEKIKALRYYQQAFSRIIFFLFWEPNTSIQFDLKELEIHIAEFMDHCLFY